MDVRVARASMGAMRFGPIASSLGASASLVAAAGTLALLGTGLLGTQLWPSGPGDGARGTVTLTPSVATARRGPPPAEPRAVDRPRRPREPSAATNDREPRRAARPRRARSSRIHAE